MWLINVRDMTMIEVVDPDRYRYVILSHRWGRDEVSFEDMADPPRARRKAGYVKIEMTCRKARDKGIPYAWIDTCCIDTTSSTALSEAINSMFRWYQLSSICIAHLFDLKRERTVLDEEDEEPGYREDRLVREMADCQWFTRGWTLQELIAPEIVEFYDRGWQFRGTKSLLRHELAHITGIDVDILEDCQLLPTVAVGRRMSWASGRETTKVEDRAYSLLGIFGINMPMIYGEGEAAFFRLQEEITRKSNDLSLFAWKAHVDGRHGVQRAQEYRGIFAQSPAEFADCRDIALCGNPLREFVLSNNGCLKIETYLAPAPNKDYIFALDCTDGTLDRQRREQKIGVYLMKTETGYVRCKISETFKTFDQDFWSGRRCPVYVRKDLSVNDAIRLRAQLSSSLIFHFHKPNNSKMYNFIARPRSLYDPNSRHFITSAQDKFTAYVDFRIRPRSWRFFIVCGLIDPKMTHPRIVGPVARDLGMVPWVAIFTDQDRVEKQKLEIIDRIIQRSNEEKALSKLREVVLGWSTDGSGELPLQDMINERKVAADYEGERQYHLVVRRDFKDDIPVFNLNVFIEDVFRLDDEDDGSDPGYTPAPGFVPRYVPQPPRARTPAAAPAPPPPPPQPSFVPQQPRQPPPQRPTYLSRPPPFVPLSGWGGGSPYGQPPMGYSPNPAAGPFSPGFAPSPMPPPGAPFGGPFGSPYAGGRGYGRGNGFGGPWG